MASRKVFKNNLIIGSTLTLFVGSVFLYTINKMGKDDFEDLKDLTIVNAHQSGLKGTKMDTVIDKIRMNKDSKERENSQK